MDFKSALDISNDGMIELALWLTKAILLFATIIISQIIIIRSIILVQEKRTEKFRKIWRIVINEAIFEEPETLPSLPKKYMRQFMAEWNIFFFSLKGESHHQLVSLAKRVNADRIAMTYLIARQPRVRMLGITTLGHMKIEKAWFLLLSISKTSDTVISLSAFRAMLHINPARATEDLFEQIISRNDWPSHNVVQILGDVDKQLIFPRMRKALLISNEEDQAKLLQLLEALHCRDLLPEIRELLKGNPDGRIISLCLQLIYQPEGREIALKYIDYFRWHVRVHAATALGRIGNPDDVNVLIKMMEDKEWWVRYRAACAINEMPFITIDKLQAIKDTMSDRYARNMMEHVIAERSLI